MPGMWIDGHETECLPGDDRGLAYGDGLFETLAVIGGRVRHAEAHLDRLEAGCRRLGIAPPARATLAAELAGHARDRERAVLKLILTRGSGGRGYAPPRLAEPRWIVRLADWPDRPHTLWREGLVMRICETRLAIQPRLAGIKHLNRLEQVLARAEWDDPEIHEGLVRDTEGRVIEGVMSNLFFRRGGTWHTPALERCGVAGVTRQRVLEAAGEEGLGVHVGDYDLEAVLGAEAAFACNTLLGVCPVRRIGERDYGVHPETRRLMARINPEDMHAG